MKLYEIMSGPQPDFVVYKVSSPKTDSTYYGYCTGEDVERCFLVGANRQDNPDRGDVKMINAAGGKEFLQYEMVDVFANEEEAFMERNDRRASDGASITGPSNFPATIFQRVLKSHPNRAAAWKMARGVESLTAREAMGDEYKGAAKYTYQDVKQLAKTPQEKQQVMHDLDSLSYPEFVRKYFPER